MEQHFTYNNFASGKAFCGRKKECNILQNLLTEKENVVMYSAPKTGKMSIIQQTLLNMNRSKQDIITCHVKLFNIISVNSFARKCASAILTTKANRPETYRNLVDTYLSDTHLYFDEDRYETLGEVISIEGEADKNDIMSIFNMVELIAQNNGQQFILILEDIDAVLQFKELEYEMILESICKVLTQIKNKENHLSSVIMTGSHVNAMKFIFEKRHYFNRLFETLPIEEYDYETLIKHIDAGFLLTGKSIDKEIASGICKTFKGHLWYINHFSAICDGMTRGYVSELIVNDAMQSMISIHEPNFINIMNDLTSHQKSLLKATLDGVTKFSSSEIITKYNLNSSANVRRVKDALMKKEIITFNDRDEPEILDPLFEYWLRNIYFENL